MHVELMRDVTTDLEVPWSHMRELLRAVWCHGIADRRTSTGREKVDAFTFCGRPDTS